MRRRLILFGLLGLLVWGCAAREPSDPFTLSEGSIGDAKRLNPITASDGASRDITGLVFNGLVKYDKTLTLVGDLAESFETTPDCRTVVFHLRKGVTWHDGAEVTADDVLFTYQRIIDPKVASAYSGDFDLVKRVEALDRFTVRVTYRAPFAPAAESWGLGVIPKHLLDGKDLNTDPFNRHPIGTGPFRFTKWQSGEYILLETNPNYFDGAPKIARYAYRITPDPAAMFLGLLRMDLDFMVLTPVQYTKQAESAFITKHFTRYRYPALGYTYMGYNLKDPKFSDRRVRQALAHAVNRQAIITGVLLGLGRPLTGPFLPNSWAYNPNAPDFPYDPGRAKALLAEAGWKDTNGDGLVDKDGRPFQFTILTNQGNEQRRKTAELIQQDLKQVGVGVEIRVMEWQTLLHEFIDKRRFEAIILGWGLGLDPDGYIIWHSSKTKEGEFNFVSYANPQVDALLIRGRETCSRPERQAIYHEVHRLIAEDQPYAFLYFPDALPIIHKRFKGIEPSPIGITYNLPTWHVPAARAEWYQ